MNRSMPSWREGGLSLLNIFSVTWEITWVACDLLAPLCLPYLGVANPPEFRAGMMSTHSFSKCLLSIYYVPGLFCVLGIQW